MYVNQSNRQCVSLLDVKPEFNSQARHKKKNPICIPLTAEVAVV